MRNRLLLVLLSGAALAAAAAPASFRDDLAQRTLACTGCHGSQGQAGPDGYYPRIAGKPAGYLYNQLLHFREGRRHYGLMTNMVDTLSDAYLADIARHFASLDLPYPAPQAATGTPEALQRGRTLALQGDADQRLPACATCHGKSLTGVQPGVPGLLGLPRDYLNAQLGAWRTGQRRAHSPDCMGDIARRLSPDDLSAVTAWLAAEPVPRDAKPAAAPVADTAAAPARRKGRKPVAAAAPVSPPPMRCGSAAMPPATGVK